jgi:uncharacterized integral membrane protein
MAAARVTDPLEFAVRIGKDSALPEPHGPPEGRAMADNVNPPSTGKWTDFVTPKLVIGVLITIAALLVIFQNTSKGDFHFLFFDVKAPRWLWLLGVFAGGAVTGYLFARHRAHVASKK